MSLLQLLGILLLSGTVGITVLMAILWLRTRRSAWGYIALGAPAGYLLLLVLVTLQSGRETLPPGTPLHFCGFYLDCHLSVSVTKVEQGPSVWRVTLKVANDARRVALAPVGLRIELVRSDRAAILLVPDRPGSDAVLQAGEKREFTVAFAAPPIGTTPTLRVTEGFGVDRIIEGVLLGDDDALGRNRVRLGL